MNEEKSQPPPAATEIELSDTAPSDEAMADEDGALPPEREHLLTAYDRLRERVLSAVEKKGGKLGADAVKVLLLVPDIFLLLVRLVMDRDVPPRTRALIGSVLAYFLLPVDLLPEALLGGAGYLEDVVLATAVLAQAFGGELEAHARKHWSGPEDLRVVLGDVTSAAHRLLGPSFQPKLEKFLANQEKKKKK